MRIYADIPNRPEMKVLGIPYTVCQSTWRKCHHCNEEWKIMEHDGRNCWVFETTSELAKLLAFSLALSLLSTRSSNTSANASGDCRWLPVTAESSGDRTMKPQSPITLPGACRSWWSPRIFDPCSVSSSKSSRFFCLSKACFLSTFSKDRNLGRAVFLKSGWVKLPQPWKKTNQN